MSTNSKTADQLQALRVRPNTGVPESFLQDNLIVCTGEDRDELLQAIHAVFPGKRPRVHHYRCYHFWKFQGITLVLSGIGTGCLEPLMWEMLDANTLGDKVAKRLALIGTAGYLSDGGFGQVYLVDGAYPVGCGVQLESADLPICPHFDGLEKIELPRAEEISTDHYYACSPRQDPRILKVQASSPELREGVAREWKPGRLISMESAQFYQFARSYGSPDTQYAAFRGVANLADQFDTQGDYAVQVLTEALRQAVHLLTPSGGSL